MKHTTLAALMEANHGANCSVTYLENERDARSVSFGEVYQRALGILYHLQRLGAGPGDKLILQLSSNEPFIDAFWAAILGGIIPVPVAVGISDEHRHKLLRIARKLGTPFIYTERRLLERTGAFAQQSGASELFEQLRVRALLVDELDDVSRAGKPHRVKPEDVAFIQFSSGSTSEPKGVVLTHANLIANIRGATEAAQVTQDDISLSWMPLTHDMGLIGFHLVLFANRARSHLMPTDLFVRRPLIWLQFASRVGATILCSPNFGYQHYLKVLGDRAASDLELSRVRLLLNGAEPISVELCEEFLARLAPAGLRRESMFPVYGLAEASLAVTFPKPGVAYQSRAFNRHQLGVGSAPALLDAHDRDALQLVAVGRAIPYCELRIASAQDGTAADGQVGHIQIRGANVTQGYFEDPAINAQTFTPEGWLRTGDLGLMQDGQLYVTGREKEILFVNGQNYYPHDLEHILAGLEGLELGKAVVAGVRAPNACADEVVIFVHFRGEPEQFLQLARQASRSITAHAGLEVSAVVPVHRIPKTTSGKVQRHLLEQEYLSGAFSAQLDELARLRATAPAVRVQDGGAIELQLQGICEQVLDGRHIDVNQSLFDISASSLKLMAIHEQIDQRWPALIDITDIFDHPSIAELAGLIDRKLSGGASA